MSKISYYTAEGPKKLKEELINSGCEIKSLPTFLK